jgi:iron complex outermembrane receptor protein
MKALRFGFSLLLAGSIAVALQTMAARAQSMDYGSLEQIFGEPITTSATGKPQRASDVPADMVILTQDDIRRSGADNIPDILQFVTGIDVRRYGYNDSEVAIRGDDLPLNPRLLVLVDGRQVYNDLFGYESWNSIPVQLDEIRQIEIVKGPNSALFGFNAASGVINIVTFDPLLDSVNAMTVRGGTQGYGEGEVVATQHFGSTAGVRISAGGWTANQYKEPSNFDLASPRYGSLNIDARWQVAPWLLLRASAGYTDTHTLLQLPIDTLAESNQHASYFRTGATMDTGMGTIDADVYRNQDLQGGIGSNVDISTVVAKIDDLVKLNAANTVRLGFDYRNVAGSSSPSIFAGKVSYDNYAADAMWNWQITHAVELTNAIRFDHLVLHQSGPVLVTPGRTSAIFNNTTLTQPSFNSGLVIHVTDADTVRLTAARGLQVPSLVDFGTQLSLTPGLYEIGVPGVHPVSVWNAELGYVRSLAPLPASLETSVYFQRNTDLLGDSGVTPIGNLYALMAENFGSSNEIGFEIGLRGTTASGFRWNGSYRYANITEDRLSNLQPGQFNALSNGTPLHEIILGAGYTWGRLEMDVAGKFQTGYTDYGTNAYGMVVPVPVPAYVTLNARIGYKVTDFLTLSGVLQQFTVSRLLLGTTPYVERRLIANATLRF